MPGRDAGVAAAVCAVAVYAAAVDSSPSWPWSLLPRTLTEGSDVPVTHLTGQESHTPMSPSSQRTIATVYFALQATLLAGFWLVMWRAPAARRWFLPSGNLTSEFASFATPDLALLAAGSLLTAWLVSCESRRARTVALVVAGGMVYATLYTAHWTLAAGAPMISLALMLVACALTLYHALRAV
jgi:hypothetical protein